MRITEIESIILLDRIHLVRVHTDEGLTGIGEVSPMNAHVTHSVIEHALAPLLVGEEATDIERLWRRLYTKPYKLGPAGAQLNAIAGIDIALWDILGKAANLPLYKLLGGKYRPGTKVYASSISRSMTPQEEAERALEYKEKGFHGYKIHSATPWMHDDGFDQTIATVTAVRSLVGDDFPILVDVNNAYYEHTAIKVARALEELGVWHFEEPLAAHDYAAYGRLADAVDIPIAVGEQEYTTWQFRDLITQGRVDILQEQLLVAEPDRPRPAEQDRVDGDPSGRDRCGRFRGRFVALVGRIGRLGGRGGPVPGIVLANVDRVDHATRHECDRDEQTQPAAGPAGRILAWRIEARA